MCIVIGGFNKPYTTIMLVIFFLSWLLGSKLGICTMLVVV